MTFDQAVKELITLAKGKPWCLTYQVASWQQDAEITAWISGVGHGDASNHYMGAVDNMRRKLEKPVLMPTDPAPEDET
jgi:hypothetical protein